MIRIVACWLVTLTLATSGCRGKDHGPAPAGTAGRSTAAVVRAAPEGATWAAVFSAGAGTGFLGVASGELGTLVAVARSRGEPVTVNGVAAIASSNDGGIGLIQLDGMGKIITGGVYELGELHRPSTVIGRSEVLVGVISVSPGEKGAVTTFPSGATTPVDGNVLALTRTASGGVWMGGANWGDSFLEGECNRRYFLARRIASGEVDLVACFYFLRAIKLVAAGDGVVLCGSQFGGPVGLGDESVTAVSFLARFGSDGAVRWVRAINELGSSACEDVVVTSDGDIVAMGVAVDDADFTEGAIAKGHKQPTSSFASVGSALWMARYTGDGTRRWARKIGKIILGDHPSLAADRDGNAVLAAAITYPLDLGHGPVGPDGAVMVATIDRDAHVRGMLVAHGGAYSVGAAVDAEHGVVMGFSFGSQVKVAGFTLEPVGKHPGAAVVRVPLPLPAPPPAP